MSFILWIIMGGILGWLASIAMGRNDQMGILLNIVVGIVGAFLGGLLLAPLFCAGYFGATVRLRRAVWIGTVLILLAVLLFNQLPQPWRGILDAGVLVGLVWGTTALAVMGWATFRDRREIVPAEVPARVPAKVPVGNSRRAGL